MNIRTMLIGACVVLRWLFVGYVGKRVVSGGLIRRASVGVDLRDVWPPALQREGKLAFCLNYSLMAFSGQDLRTPLWIRRILLIF